MKISATDKKFLVAAQVVLQRLSAQGKETPDTIEARALSVKLARWLEKVDVADPAPSPESPEVSR